MKVYAKADGLLRVEVVLADRPALQALDSGVREVGGPEAIELLVELSSLAEEKLGRALDHVAAARGGVRPLVLLASELRSLEELALGVGEGAGRKPGREAREGASLAFSALATTGHFCGRNLRKRTALRTVLDDLSEGDGPLQCARGASTPSGHWPPRWRRSGRPGRERRPRRPAPACCEGAGADLRPLLRKEWEGVHPRESRL